MYLHMCIYIDETYSCSNTHTHTNTHTQMQNYYANVQN